MVQFGFPSVGIVLRRRLLPRHDATKTKMIGAGIDFSFAACAHYVTRTVLIVAKKRAAAVHALFLVRLGWVDWWTGAARILGRAARFGQCLVIIRPVPIAAPFPNVAGHVVKAVTI